MDTPLKRPESAPIRQAVSNFHSRSHTLQSDENLSTSGEVEKPAPRPDVEPVVVTEQAPVPQHSPVVRFDVEEPPKKKKLFGFF